MNINFLAKSSAIILLTFPAAVFAWSDQVKDGEAGYKMGCSLASSMNIPSCGELPSGKKFMPSNQSNSKSGKKQSSQDSSDSKSSQSSSGSGGGARQAQ